jgi:hypothetical protein
MTADDTLRVPLAPVHHLCRLCVEVEKCSADLSVSVSTHVLILYDVIAQ